MPTRGVGELLVRQPAERGALAGPRGGTALGHVGRLVPAQHGAGGAEIGNLEQAALQLRQPRLGGGAVGGFGRTAAGLGSGFCLAGLGPSLGHACLAHECIVVGGRMPTSHTAARRPRRSATGCRLLHWQDRDAGPRRQASMLMRLTISKKARSRGASWMISKDRILSPSNCVLMRAVPSKEWPVSLCPYWNAIRDTQSLRRRTQS